MVFTDSARGELREVEGADRLTGIPPGVLSRESMRALLAGTELGELLDALDALAADPYGGLSLPRTADFEDDRTALLGALAVTYLVSSATQPPVLTVTGIRGPKG